MFHFQWKETQRVLKPWKTIRIKLQTLLAAIYSSPGYCRYTHSMKCQCTHEQRLCTKKRKALVWSNCFTVTPYSTGWTGRTMGCYKFYTWDQAHMHTEIYMTYADIQRERESEDKQVRGKECVPKQLCKHLAPASTQLAIKLELPLCFYHVTPVVIVLIYKSCYNTLL